MVPGGTGRAFLVARAEGGLGVEQVDRSSETWPANLSSPAVHRVPVRSDVGDRGEEPLPVEALRRKDSDRRNLELPLSVEAVALSAHLDGRATLDACDARRILGPKWRGR